MTRKELLTKHKYKFAALFISVFCLTCLNLCAEEMSAARAQTCRQNLVTEAKKYIGCPYVYGAAGPDTFDCSGLIFYIAKEVNKTSLPRTAKALYDKSTHISDDERQPGDLVFFKTTSSGNVSHVGIYIGNNQFISAVSDGPNTGVILSSINENYWKSHYIGAGQIYKPSKLMEDLENTETKVAVLDEKAEPKTPPKSEPAKTGPKRKVPVREIPDYKKPGKSVPKNAVSIKDNDDEDYSNTSDYYEDHAGGTTHSSKRNLFGEYFEFLEDTIIDASLAGNWSFLNTKTFDATFRGIDLMANARLGYRSIEPGLGLGIRWNYWMNMVQIPVTLSLSLNEYVRLYMGPVFSFTSGVTHDTQEKLSSSIFPGILGISLSSPSIELADLKFQLIQDISYSYFNNPDNSAPGFVKSLSSGLVLSSGLRITLPEF